MRRTTHLPAPLRRGVRPTATVVALWVPLLVVVAIRLLRWDELPELLPTHWSGLGAPDDYTRRSVVWAVTLGVCAVAGAVGTAAIVARSRVNGRNALLQARAVAAGAAAVAAGAAAVWGTVVWATLAGGSNQDATLGARALLVPAALLWAVLPLRLLRVPAAQPDGSTGSPRLPLADGERAAWRVGAVSRPLLGALLGALVVVVVAAVFVPAVWPVVVVPVIALAAFATVTVTVDHRGLRVTGGLGVPLLRVPLDDVATVHSADVRAAEWGGWGLRMAPGRRAVVLRSGPGLVVERRDGRRCAVTVDDAATGAALLGTLAGVSA